MKKYLLFIFTLSTLSLFSQSIGTTFSDQGFNFRITALSPNEVAITGGGSGSSITIPETVTFNMESYTVVEVGEFAFDGDPFTQLTNVVFPNSIRTIGQTAFAENSLTSILLPTSLEIIGEEAFAFNSLSGTLILPEGLTIIERDAFLDNTNLSEVIFPTTLSTIGKEVFASVPLKKITLRSNISIGSRAFGSHALTSIISEIINPSGFPINSNDISNSDRANIDLVIPSGTTQAYIDAGWTGFKSVTEANEPTLSISDNTLQESAIELTLLDTQLVVENRNSNLIALELYDLSGALVYSTIENVVDTAVFSKGVYILRMTFEGSTVVRKIIL